MQERPTGFGRMQDAVRGQGADQDRGATSLAGLLTLAAGIVGFIVQDNAETDIEVDGRAATLFVAIGAAVFVLALVPWWSRRRTTVVDRRVDAY